MTTLRPILSPANPTHTVAYVLETSPALATHAARTLIEYAEGVGAATEDMPACAVFVKIAGTSSDLSRLDDALFKAGLTTDRGDWFEPTA